MGKVLAYRTHVPPPLLAAIIVPAFLLVLVFRMAFWDPLALVVGLRGSPIWPRIGPQADGA
jgi:hypothetical protein